ncbi:hypothetical protein [Spirosoma flavum]|uniref:Glycosyltransferase RgtA/B/C/D-like domain-containing protein n=1 Tax=Spirosoma flavum TaxID=2048557 RepID=A0ABW6AR91_9BACT
MTLSTTQTHFSNISVITRDNKLYRQYFLAIWAFYLLIASLLAILVRYGVMDEDFHLAASRSFANFGVNPTTLSNHVPPTGVASHIWFALWIWLFPGINYIGLRLITCAGIAILAGCTFVQLKNISVVSQRKIVAVSLFMLAFPYFFLSVSTVMTEGPALLCLFAGLLLLFVSRLQHLLPFFLGCLLLGFTTIARFYFIPLLPALVIVLLLSHWRRYVQHGFKSIGAAKVLMYLAIGVSLLPLVGLIFLWRGLTPPAFNQWSILRSGISFNAFRPFSTLAITGVYIAPVVLLNISLTSALLVRTLSIALCLALILAVCEINLFHDSLSVSNVFSGPIEHSLAWIKSKGDMALYMGLFTIYSLSLFSLAIVIKWTFYYIRKKDFSDKGLLFSVVFVFFFVVSQAFVGGNHPFFERYLFHPWPFIGYIIVSMFPGFLNVRTYLALAAYTLLSVIILTKWGIV